MLKWQRLLVVGALLLTLAALGAARLVRSPESTAEPPLTDSERYALYRELESRASQFPGVTYMGYDGQMDQLYIGVGTQESADGVRRETASLGLPPDSVRLETPERMLSETDPLAGCITHLLPAGETDTLLLSSKSLKAGESFTLTLPAGGAKGDVTRGIDAYLECWDGKAWTPRYTLFTAHNQYPPRAVVYNPTGPIISLGLSGPGPEPHVLPSGIRPGWYRISKRAAGGEPATAILRVIK